MRRLRIIAGIVGVVVAALTCFLTWAHWQVRRVRPPLPDPAFVSRAIGVIGGPTRLSYINTATQGMPRRLVLEPSLDRNPEKPYVMSHPSFVLEWEDGRVLLVDVGMTRAGALQFGKGISAMGGEPIQPLTSTADALDGACAKVGGIVFTHLHSDHVGGVDEICKCAGHEIPVFMTDVQASVSNHTTYSQIQQIRASKCLKIVEVPEGVATIPGFPGVAVARAAGHTPGSQAVFASVQGTTGQRSYALAGDLANNADGFMSDIPKPKMYSLLLVPEDTEQLSLWRRFLHSLAATGYRVLVAHDQLAIEAAEIPPFNPR